MDINAILLELLSRIKVLEDKVKELEERDGTPGSQCYDKRPPFPRTEISTKYLSLARYLYESGEKKIALTYKEIEDILGFSLPETAHNFPKSYWANTKTHSYATAWLNVGYKARVIAEEQTVIFDSVLIY